MERPLYWPVPSGAMAALAESVLGAAAVLASAYIRFGLEVHFNQSLLFRVIVVAVVWQCCLYYADLYGRRTMLDRQLTIIRIGKATGVASLALSVIYYWFPDLMIGRGIMLIALLVLPTLAFTQRLVVDWSVRRHGGRQRMLIVPIQHRNRLMHDDRTMIEFFIDEMDRASRNFHAISERLLLCFEPRKRRQQGRVDIQDPLRKLLYKPRR